MSEPGMNDDIVELIAARLEYGKKQYPDGMPLHDHRDLVQEALEEALDASVYLAGELIRIKEMRRLEAMPQTVGQTEEEKSSTKNPRPIRNLYDGRFTPDSGD